MKIVNLNDNKIFFHKFAKTWKQKNEIICCWNTVYPPMWTKKGYLLKTRYFHICSILPKVSVKFTLYYNEKWCTFLVKILSWHEICIFLKKKYLSPLMWFLRKTCFKCHYSFTSPILGHLVVLRKFTIWIFFLETISKYRSFTIKCIGNSHFTHFEAIEC